LIRSYASGVTYPSPAPSDSKPAACRGVSQRLSCGTHSVTTVYRILFYLFNLYELYVRLACVSRCKERFDELGCFKQCWGVFFSDRAYFFQFQPWIAVSVPNLTFLKPNSLLCHSDIISLARPLTDWGIFSRKRQHRQARVHSSPACLRSLKNEAGSQRMVAVLEGAPYRVVKVDRNAQAGSAVHQ